MAENAAEVIKLRNEFYRDNYRRVFIALLFMLIIIFIISQLFIVYLILNTSKQYAQALNKTETSLNSQILLNNKDFQNKINSLTGRVVSISEEQTSLQDEQTSFSAIFHLKIKEIVVYLKILWYF